MPPAPRALDPKHLAKAIRAEMLELALELWPPIEETNGDGPREWEEVLLGSAPPGQDYVHTCSVDLWPLSIVCRLTCSAAVADRGVALEYQLGTGQRYCVAGANVTLAASQQQSFCWQPAAGTATWPVEDVALAALPQQLIPYGRKVAIHVTNMDSADQLDQVAISARFSLNN